MTKRQRAEFLMAGGGALGFSVLLFLFPKVGADSVSRSLALCARSIVPSLFLFAALAQILVKSGLFLRLGAFARPLGLSTGGLTVVLVGLLCGFPMGAAVARTLYAEGKITRRESFDVLPICGNAGMAFVVGTVGETFWESRAFGIRLFLIQTGLSLIWLLLGVPRRRRRSIHFSEADKPAESPIALLVSSVSSAGGAMVTVTSFLLFFGAVADYLLFFSRSFLPTSFRPVICSFLELGRGCAEFASFRNRAPLYGALGTAWSIGFSGLSVIFQNLERAGDARPRFFSFFFKRVLFGLLLVIAVFLTERG